MLTNHGRPTPKNCERFFFFAASPHPLFFAALRLFLVVKKERCGIESSAPYLYLHICKACALLLA